MAPLNIERQSGQTNLFTVTGTLGAVQQQASRGLIVGSDLLLFLTQSATSNPRFPLRDFAHVVEIRESSCSLDNSSRRTTKFRAAVDILSAGTAATSARKELGEHLARRINHSCAASDRCKAAKSNAAMGLIGLGSVSFAKTADRALAM